MSLFSGDSVWGRLGNAFADNSKIGQGYQAISNIASKFGSDDKSYSGKLGLSDNMPAFNEENIQESPKYPNGIFGESQSDKMPQVGLNPYTPLIAPQMAGEIDPKGFRPGEGSGIWKVLSLV